MFKNNYTKWTLNADKIQYCKPLLSFLYGKNRMMAVRYTYVLVSTAVPYLAEKSYLQVTTPFSNKPCFKNFMFTACIFSKTMVLQYVSWTMCVGGPVEGSYMVIISRCKKSKIILVQFQQDLYKVNTKCSIYDGFQHNSCVGMSWQMHAFYVIKLPWWRHLLYHHHHHHHHCHQF